MAGNRTVPIFYRADREVDETIELSLMDYDIEGDIAWATLNDPASMNGMSMQSFWEMHIIIEAARRDNRVKALIWTGAGKAFSAGMSLRPVPTTIPQDVQDGYLAKGIGPQPAVANMPDFAAKGLVMQILRFPKFCMAAVNGVAVGGGVTFPLMLCDYIIATQDVRFRMPFTDLGFAPEIASSYLLARNIGMVRAKQLILLAEWFSSSQALSWGLINQVVPAEQLKQEAKAIALQAAGLGQNAIRLSKYVMHKPLLEVLDKHMDAENSNFLEAFSGKEAQERFAAKAKKVGKSKL
jgi:enoyl-CoA hydratase/carnithine racemase